METSHLTYIANHWKVSIWWENLKPFQIWSINLENDNLTIRSHAPRKYYHCSKAWLQHNFQLVYTVTETAIENWQRHKKMSCTSETHSELTQLSQFKNTKVFLTSSEVLASDDLIFCFNGAGDKPSINGNIVNTNLHICSVHN